MLNGKNKISALKVFQSVKCGSKELVFIKEEGYDMVLEGWYVTITCKRTKAQVITPITNTPWFTLQQPKPEEALIPPSENQPKPAESPEVKLETKPNQTQVKASKEGKDQREQGKSPKDSSRTRPKASK